MPHAYFSQHIDTAFEARAGSAGASRERFDHWRGQLAGSLAGIRQQPPREAVPMLALPTATDDLPLIDALAARIRDNFTDLLVVGMGGSSLSGETLASISPRGSLSVHIVDNIDPHTLGTLTNTLNWATTAVLIISKSGGTVETLAHTAVFLRAAKNNVKDYARHFFIITIPNDNPLHRLAREHGFEILAHDPDLGGRFSILSSVGLLPAAALGLDIRALRAGAASIIDANFMDTGCNAVDSAALHMALMERGIAVNVLMHYSDRLGGLAKWYRQCWAESLGKSGRGTTPVRSRGVTDQHGQLQLYLDGPKDKLFTAMMLDYSGQGASIGIDGTSDARIAHLRGHTLGDLLMAEEAATHATIVERGCPLRSFTFERLDAPTMGALLMHLMLEIMFTAHLMGVNAFDQPAVEESKRLALANLKASA